MDNELTFDYYYGKEAEQFSFYRIPRILIKDERFKGISSDAKLLYGLMLDRMSLSMKNGWFDDQNRAYIHYTFDNVMEDLGCGREKCCKIFKELDTKHGIGLIEKKRQGLGKPDIIYVKNFIGGYEDGIIAPTEDYGKPDELPEVRISNFQTSEREQERSTEIELTENTAILEVGKTNFTEQETTTSGSTEIEPLEVREPNGNYNYNNYNNRSHIYLINQATDMMDEVEANMELIFPFESKTNFD